MSRPTCDVEGISWNTRMKRWQITVYDVFATGKEDDAWRKTDSTFGLNEKDQAIEKHAQIKAEVDARWERETARIAAQYSWTHDLPRAPKKEEAEMNKKYWKENDKDGYKPRCVVLASGGKQRLQYKNACHADGCTLVAQIDTTGATQYCHYHQREHGLSKFNKQHLLGVGC